MIQPETMVAVMKEREAELEADNARLRDLVAKFQSGKPSDKFEKHGA